MDILEQNLTEIRKLFGIEFLKIQPGYTKSHLKVKAEHMNYLNVVYGGVLFNMADLTSGIAFISDGAIGATASGIMEFLSGARNVEELVCEATVRAGSLVPQSGPGKRA